MTAATLGAQAAGAPVEARHSAPTIIERLFVLMRTIGVHGESHPIALQAAAALNQTIEEATPPFALQFVDQASFFNQTLVPLPLEPFLHSRELARALTNLSVNELCIDAAPGAESLLELGKALARGAQSPSDVLEHIRVTGIRWREIPHARWGAQSEEVDPELFAATQVTLAIGKVEEFEDLERPWPWSDGASIIRRLERSLVVHPAVTFRVLETAPGQWTVPRRAIAACLQTLDVLRSIDASVSTQRAAAHAALALALHGLAPRGGSSLGAAVDPTMRRLLAAPVKSRSGIEPHRLKVCALIHAFGVRGADSTQWLAAMHPIQIAYEMERQRCPDGVPFNLTRVDLLAQAVQCAGKVFDATWVQVLVKASGTIPPGATVRLADGRTGVALEPGPSGDPLRPLVLVDGEILEPPHPVELQTGAASGGLSN